jgi:hypothetical protein
MLYGCSLPTGTYFNVHFRLPVLPTHAPGTVAYKIARWALADTRRCEFLLENVSDSRISTRNYLYFLYNRYNFTMDQKEIRKLNLELLKQPMPRQRPFLIAGFLFAMMVVVFTVYCFCTA